MKREKVYLEDGQEAYLDRQLEDGKYLVYVNTGSNDHYDSVLQDYVEKTVWFSLVVSTIHEEPPVIALNEEIESRKEILESINEAIKEKKTELSKINEEIRTAQDAFIKISDGFDKYEQLINVRDFIEGKITHYVKLNYDGLEIVKFEDEKCEQNYKLLCLFGNKKVELEWKLNYYSDGSGGYSCVIPCISYEHAIEEMTDIITNPKNIYRVRRYSGELADHTIVKCSEKYGIPIAQEIKDRLTEHEKNKIEKQYAKAEKEMLIAKTKLDNYEKYMKARYNILRCGEDAQSS